MKEVCSEEHAERLRALHARDPNFGVIGHLWANRVADMMIEFDCDSALDYGCGRSNLIPAVVVRMHELNKSCSHRQEYDPATAPGEPQPADFVTCIDVLEHVEKDKLDAVLHDIRRCMKKGALVTVSLRNGTPKNRRTHPNIHPREWWLAKLSLELGQITEIEILDPTKAKSELAVLVRPFHEADL